MIECLCINDSDRPDAIPKKKWVVKDQIYNVVYTVTVLPQNQLGFHLAEIDLDESCKPYEYFLANRFAFTQEGLLKLIELIKDCNDLDFNMDELLEQTKIKESI
jgi:hypothetical protein